MDAAVTLPFEVLLCPLQFSISDVTGTAWLPLSSHLLVANGFLGAGPGEAWVTSSLLSCLRSAEAAELQTAGHTQLGRSSQACQGVNWNLPKGRASSGLLGSFYIEGRRFPSVVHSLAWGSCWGMISLGSQAGQCPENPTLMAEFTTRGSHGCSRQICLSQPWLQAHVLGEMR